MNRDAQAALDHQVADLIIVGYSRLAIQQAMGVIACKHSALQVELVRHKESATRFNCVHYLHTLRCNSTEADVLATEALDVKTANLLLGEERYEELRKLSRIQEKLVRDSKPDESSEAMPVVSAITRSTTRRARFADQLGDGRPTERSDESVGNQEYEKCVDTQ